ncbi:MAG: phosphodiesterase [Candidatus Thermofonsia Clade 1 bacterium]|uniref:Phosphodiesterase n=1 Tax=Candidatus Thermofonsia Clade 1 bacterium TaxID=2364210 RepID=A0A2M8PFP0_9CHLR|nr:MAG: phosphodiesterase [Candidatus Thermofonsia Clade 1 bacterium]RMF53045.1 MAG: alkaline phosphatase family protein [Chloroflexota bacterium]
MFNQESVQHVNAARLNDAFVRPLYEGYSFAQLPQSVRRALTGIPGGLPPKAFGHLPQRYRKVVLFLVDSFGWRFFISHHENYPALKRFADEGVISKISVQFPSTTAAHVTTINSMQSVGESGVYEWFYYEPKLDAIIAPLTFSYAATPRETLRHAIAPQAILPYQTLYQDLANYGVQSYAFQDSAYAHSSYSKTLLNGAKIVPFQTLAQGLVNLRSILESAKEPTYCFFYYAPIDSSAHSYGPDSRHHRAEIDMFFTALERLFFADLPRDNETLILLTADHGQVEVDPSTTRYLNRELPQLTPLLRTDRHGAPLVPAGSARDMFLYVKAPHLQEAYELLTAHLRGTAEVYRTADLLEEGFFGARCSEIFRARLGELVILPYAHQSVWWYEQGKFEQVFLGHHGGLTPDEMHSVFMALAR